jgi:hypothetical protein
MTGSREFSPSLLQDRAKKAALGTKAAAVIALLDSLGFFLCTFDTLRGDTIRITPNGRGLVEKISIKGIVPVSIDSIGKLSLPRP